VRSYRRDPRLAFVSGLGVLAWLAAAWLAFGAGQWLAAVLWLLIAAVFILPVAIVLFVPIVRINGTGLTVYTRLIDPPTYGRASVRSASTGGGLVALRLSEGSPLSIPLSAVAPRDRPRLIEGITEWMQEYPEYSPNMNPEEYLFALLSAIEARESVKGFDSLTPAEQDFTIIWALEAEVNNGGFDQYYWNSSGDSARRAPAALRSIGAAHTAALVDQANSVFGPDGPPEDRLARQSLAGAFDDRARHRLEELDSGFMEYRDNLSELLADRMKSAVRGTA